MMAICGCQTRSQIDPTETICGIYKWGHQGFCRRTHMGLALKHWLTSKSEAKNDV